MSTEDRGDAPRHFMALHNRGGMAHAIMALSAIASTICFATSSMTAPPGARAEDDAAPDSKPAGTEPDGACKACGMANEKDAKFCDQCGASMAAEQKDPEDPDDDPDEDDKADAAPDSTRPGHPAPAAAAHAQAPRKMSPTASLAAILGATSESPLALKTAAIGLRQIFDTAAGVTGKTNPAEIVGGLLAVPAKLERGKQARTELGKLRATTDDAERWVLARQLNASGAVKRDKIFADLLDDAGQRVLDKGGKPKLRIRSKYAAMDLGVLRGLVTDLEADAPTKRRNPFEPDAAAAADASREARQNGGAGPADAKARIEAAKKSPAVLRMHGHPNNTRTLEQIAEAWIRNEDAARGASAGGAQ